MDASSLARGGDLLSMLLAESERDPKGFTPKVRGEFGGEVCGLVGPVCLSNVHWGVWEGGACGSMCETLPPNPKHQRPPNPTPPIREKRIQHPN